MSMLEDRTGVLSRADSFREQGRAPKSHLFLQKILPLDEATTGQVQNRDPDITVTSLDGFCY